MSRLQAPTARLVAFVALAAFAVVHWAALVEAPPAGRLVLAVGAIVAGAVLLEAIGHAGLRRLPAALVGAAGGLAATALALAAVGISLPLLWPAGWGELGTNLDSGLAGLAGDVDYPYAEGNEWSRLAILAVAPLALGLAATLAFWPAPGRARTPLRLAGLAVLVTVYAAAIAANPPDGALARGAVLVALVAAWLWLPALRWRDTLVATALVAVAGALAVPAAAQLEADDPWLDYKSWTLRTADGKTFRWEHSYGPINWDRDGTRMLSVESDRPHYWKTLVLDRFDGVRWTRSDATPEAPIRGADADGGLPPSADRDWVNQITVTIGNLTSDLVVGAGTPLRIRGLSGVNSAPDGTAIVGEEPLEKGDSYTINAYVPDPTVDRMRAAEGEYPATLAPYTELELPAEQAGASEPASPQALAVPLRGAPADDGVEGTLASSPYREMYELTRRLVDGRPTAYDAVRAIQDHLRSTYTYSELPPAHRYPLDAFLFQDRRGYCQQFSGAMALMLRMAGIPSRVVGGFAPGTRDEERNVFRVEDFDAHSWVEVYFNDIGWVAFDPTPSTAPAASQQTGFPSADTGREQSAPEPQEDEEQAPPGAASGAGGSGGASSATTLLAPPAALLGLLALAAALVGARAARHRRLIPAAAANAQLGEITAALDRFGWPTSGGATLLTLERRLRRSRRRAAARYVGRLRAIRYAAAEEQPPSLAERRAVRRELSSARGLSGRLRALVAIPPGGPRIP